MPAASAAGLAPLLQQTPRIDELPKEIAALGGDVAEANTDNQTRREMTDTSTCYVLFADGLGCKKRKYYFGLSVVTSRARDMCILQEEMPFACDSQVAAGASTAGLNEDFGRPYVTRTPPTPS